MQVDKKLTATSLYDVVFRELLASAWRKARCDTAEDVFLFYILKGLEHVVCSKGTSPLVAAGTVVCDFGLQRPQRPVSRYCVQVGKLGLSARLSRSKTLGADKVVWSRPLVVESFLAVGGKSASRPLGADEVEEEEGLKAASGADQEKVSATRNARRCKLRRRSMWTPGEGSWEPICDRLYLPTYSISTALQHTPHR